MPWHVVQLLSVMGEPEYVCAPLGVLGVQQVSGGGAEDVRKTPRQRQPQQVGAVPGVLKQRGDCSLSALALVVIVNNGPQCQSRGRPRGPPDASFSRDGRLAGGL